MNKLTNCNHTLFPNYMLPKIVPLAQCPPWLANNSLVLCLIWLRFTRELLRFTQLFAWAQTDDVLITVVTVNVNVFAHLHSSLQVIINTGRNSTINSLASSTYTTVLFITLFQMFIIVISKPHHVDECKTLQGRFLGRCTHPRLIMVLESFPRTLSVTDRILVLVQCTNADRDASTAPEDGCLVDGHRENLCNDKTCGQFREHGPRRLRTIIVNASSGRLQVSRERILITSTFSRRLIHEDFQNADRHFGEQVMRTPSLNGCRERSIQWLALCEQERLLCRIPKRFLSRFSYRLPATP